MPAAKQVGKGARDTGGRGKHVYCPFCSSRTERVGILGRRMTWHQLWVSGSGEARLPALAAYPERQASLNPERGSGVKGSSQGSQAGTGAVDPEDAHIRDRTVARCRRGQAVRPCRAAIGPS